MCECVTVVALRPQHQQKGLSPKMFKALVSKGHPEFSSSRQQDAQEFLQHVITLVEVSPLEPTRSTSLKPGIYRII